LYASAFVANLGSVGLEAAYHHLFEYGTIPIFVTLGRVHRAPVVLPDGSVGSREIFTLRYTYDERVEDGFYAARALERLQAGLEARVGRGAYRLRDARISSFGGTLEWYVAEVLVREFGCAATWGLRIPRATHGGDYDVVACAEGEVIYVETKSAPPRQIIQE